MSVETASELQGTMVEGDLPPGLLEALATRAERGAFPSLALGGPYSVERIDAGAIRIVAKEARTAGAVGLDDTELAIDDRGRLHYHVRAGHLAAVHRKITHVLHGVGATVALVVVAAGGVASWGLAHLLFWTVLSPVIIGVLLSARRRQFARTVLEGALREEIAGLRRSTR